MITINLDLPYRVKAGDRQMLPENKHISEYLMRTLVAIRYQQGMNRSDTRQWGELMDALDEATSDKEKTTVEVERSTFLWFVDVVNWCLDNSKVPPLAASWVNILLEQLQKPSTTGEPKLKVVE